MLIGMLLVKYPNMWQKMEGIKLGHEEVEVNFEVD